jgi:hypothetical protein
MVLNGKNVMGETLERSQELLFVKVAPQVGRTHPVCGRVERFHP